MMLALVRGNLERTTMSKDPVITKARIEIIDPDHCLFGSVLECQKTVRYPGNRGIWEEISYFIDAVRPFDAKNPITEDYRRFVQVLPPAKVKELPDATTEEETDVP
jgi:hypothetical protein